MLPDLSKRISTLAGTSPIPDPGGSAFPKTLLVRIKIENKILINNVFIFILI
jgi:hypothetical protein